ncbi:MAG TPA: hypothetical protein VIV12_01180, partial [Streptosporangiaceae bacterium]
VTAVACWVASSVQILWVEHNRVDCSPSGDGVPFPDQALSVRRDHDPKAMGDRTQRRSLA